jgi:hypothetical protein
MLVDIYATVLESAVEMYRKLKEENTLACEANFST